MPETTAFLFERLLVFRADDAAAAASSCSTGEEVVESAGDDGDEEIELSTTAARWKLVAEFPKESDDQTVQRPSVENILTICALPSTSFADDASQQRPQFWTNVLTDGRGRRQTLYCLQVVETSEDRRNSPLLIVLVGGGKRNSRDARRLLSTLAANPNPEILASEIGASSLEEDTLTPTVVEGDVSVLISSLGTPFQLLSVLLTVLSEGRLLFVSKSAQKLGASVHALLALIYPLDYAYTLVPILPQSLIDLLDSPSPYVAGVVLTGSGGFVSEDGGELRRRVNGATIVDLDTGYMSETSSPDASKIEEIVAADKELSALLQSLVEDFGSLEIADELYREEARNSSEVEISVRRRFLKFWRRLFADYRRHLLVVRMATKPLPVVRFHRAAFLGVAPESRFLRALTALPFFADFVTKRGAPFRECDLFDELAAAETEDEADRLIDKHFQRELTAKATECLPPPDLSKGIERRNWEEIFVAAEKLPRLTAKSPPTSAKRIVVPRVTTAEKLAENRENAISFQKRRRVLLATLEALFDARMGDARKTLPSVELHLRDGRLRILLLSALEKRAAAGCQLLSAQFEIVARLVNVVLAHESEDDERGVAFTCLQLAGAFCRQLPNGSIQFLYTAIQSHPVWRNAAWWESAFAYEAARLLHASHGGLKLNERSENLNHTWQLDDESTGDERKSALVLCAKRMTEGGRMMENVDQEDQDEQALIEGVAKHFVHLAVQLRVPISAARGLADGGSSTLVSTTSPPQAMEDEISTENGDDDNNEQQQQQKKEGGEMERLVRWLTRWLDASATNAGLSSGRVAKIVESVPLALSIHVDGLAEVCEEVERMAPLTQRASLSPPALYTPAERVLWSCAKCWLLPSCSIDDSRLLPAIGALILTNYRLLFKGHSADLLASEQPVIRSVAVQGVADEQTASEREIREVLSSARLLSQLPQDLTALVSWTPFAGGCALIVAFGRDETTADELWPLFARLASLRRPSESFAFADRIGAGGFGTTGSTFHINENAFRTAGHRTAAARTFRTLKSTLRSHMAPQLKATLDKSFAKLAVGGTGLPRPETPSSRYRQNSQSGDGQASTNRADYIDLGESPSKSSAAADNLSTPAGQAYLADGERTSLLARGFRVSKLNRAYDKIESYSASLIVPSDLDDDSLLKLRKYFRDDRIPVATWGGRNGSLLLRGAKLQPADLASRFGKRSTANASLHDSHPMADAQSLDSTHSGISKKSGFTVASRNAGARKQNRLEAFLTCLAEIVPSSGVKRKFEMESRENDDDSLWSLESTSVGSIESKENRHKVHHQQSRVFVIGEKSTRRFVAPSLSSAGISFLAAPALASTGAVREAWKQSVRSRSTFSRLKRDNLTSEIGDDDDLWRQIVLETLEAAAAIAELLDDRPCAVVLCESSGRDTTPILASLIQVIIDPFYRTFKGLQALVEKEWLALGHRFASRAAVWNSDFSAQNVNQMRAEELKRRRPAAAPFFLLFLDCLHQIHRQCRAAFEYDEFTLRFLAYHSYSGFFSTFLFDAERARVANRAALSVVSHDLWASIEERVRQTPAGSPFLNARFVGPEFSDALQISTSPVTYRRWTKLFDESPTAHGAAYDLEAAESELSAAQADVDDGTTPGNSRSIDPTEIADELRVNEKSNAHHVGEVQDSGNSTFYSPSSSFSRSSDTDALDDFSRRALRKRALKWLTRLSQRTDDPTTTAADETGADSAPKASASKSAVPDASSLQGYLLKRGARLGLWTPRWYVLDERQHKIFYYDKTPLDGGGLPRGSIDLLKLAGVAVLDEGSQQQQQRSILQLRLASSPSLGGGGGKVHRTTIELASELPGDVRAWCERIERLLQD